MRKDSKNGDGFYQRQTSVDKHNDCCIAVQSPIKTNEILDKQEEFIEEVHRENDMLRKVVSLLQQVLDNRKQWSCNCGKYDLKNLLLLKTGFKYCIK